jgi:hypothetical protein
VGKMNGQGDYSDEFGCFSRSDGPRPGDVFQSIARHVFHDDERSALVLAYVVHCDNVRVLQLSRSSGLIVDSLFRWLASQMAEGHELYGNNSVQFRLTGFVNHSHAAPTYLLQKFVLSDSQAHSGAWRRVFGLTGRWRLANDGAQQATGTKAVGGSVGYNPAAFWAGSAGSHRARGMLGSTLE